jgi:hypothetical protein
MFICAFHLEMSLFFPLYFPTFVLDMKYFILKDNLSLI